MSLYKKFLLLLSSVVMVLIYSHATQPDEKIIRNVVYGDVAEGAIYTSIGNPADIFITQEYESPKLLILNSTGEIITALPATTSPIAFQKLPSGNHAYATVSQRNNLLSAWYIENKAGLTTKLTSQYAEITDPHTLLETPTGQYILPGYKTHVTSPTSSVISFTLEKTDGSTSTLLWDSYDHIPVTDKIALDSNTPWDSEGNNNYFHGNHITYTNDGNLLISARNTSQVIKIDINSGKVLWKLGGKSSDFAFIDDPYHGFNHQHSVHELANGNILLYDNGNYHNPPITRMVEYELNKETMQARLVWSYSQPGRFTYAAGSVQRLPNGNTLIGWGMEPSMSSTTPRITEINKSGETMLDIFFPENILFYSAYKF